MYPKIQLNVINDNLPTTLITNISDIVISELDIKDSRLNKDYLGKTDRGIFASIEYIKKHGIPKTTDDLKKHNCLVYTNVTPTHEWIFNNKKIKVSGNYVSNSPRNIGAMAISGLGLIWGSKTIFKEEVTSGKLVEIPLANTTSTRKIWIYSLPNYDINIKLMIKHLKNSFTQLHL
jgi:DNA-binding transcriptional LysR family regulator